MTNRTFRSFLGGNPLVKMGTVAIGIFVLFAVFADFLADDLPIFCRFHHKLYLLPNIARPAELKDYDCFSLQSAQKTGDFSVNPLSSFGPRQTTMGGIRIAPLEPPGSQGHWLGTDALGRDVWARFVYGARTALGIGLLAVTAFIAIGLALGAIAGFFGGLVDGSISRLVEALTAFPTVIFVLVVQAILPHPTTLTMLLAIGLTRWPEVARIVRAEILLASSQDYVLAARALGAGPWRVLQRHVLPNAKAPLLVAVTFGVASVILIEAELAFLQVGISPMASWGEMMAEVRHHPSAWWLFAFPAVALLTVLVSFNVAGEALRDALDPRLRGLMHDERLPPSTSAVAKDLSAGQT